MFVKLRLKWRIKKGIRRYLFLLRTGENLTSKQDYEHVAFMLYTRREELKNINELVKNYNPNPKSI